MKISNYVVDTKNTMLPVNQIGIFKIYYRIMCNSLFFSSGALKSIEKRSPNFFFVTFINLKDIFLMNVV